MRRVKGSNSAISRALLLATAAALSATSAYAQSPDNTGQRKRGSTDIGGNSPADDMGAIVVTARRRSEDISKIPFNISAYSSEQLQKSNITSVTALSQEVPNFTITDTGAGRTAGSIPIIRGLNASAPTSNFSRFFQSPVGFYLGNAPITGVLPIQDIDRVEVLRGPQGTLYGAGALAGAVRLIPTEPKLGSVSGLVSGSVAAVSHSSDVDHNILGVLNLPLGSSAALRVVGQQEYDAGFIDQHDILRRTGDDYLHGIPVLANPSDVAASPGVYFNKKDANYTRTNSARAMLVWRPAEALKLLAAYSYARVTGQGTPTDNYTYPGGVSPLDPRSTLAPTGKYELSSPSLQPFKRTTQLASLDLSYDMGFATLSATGSYGTTQGQSVIDGTIGILGSYFAYYYTGTPANPRFVFPETNIDRQHTATAEVRLVSTKGATLDYTVGAFFQRQVQNTDVHTYGPGAAEQSAAANGGSTVPIALGGTWIGPSAPDGSLWYQQSRQVFDDYSIFGDLTWHVTDRWQLTGGARVFHESNKQNLYINAAEFLHTDIFDANNSLTSQIFKLNSSYQLDPHAQIYATFSQGFRRGGVNAFPTTGYALEPTELRTYQPDKTNNYELGLKGRIYGLTYAIDAFYVDWKKAQIDLLTPNNAFFVVVNANGAHSKGVEAEISGSLARGLTGSLGFAYSPARLSESFSLPAGTGSGTIDPNGIHGTKGDRLPGSPDISASFNLNYRVAVGKASALEFNGGIDYRGSTINQLASLNPARPANTAPGYALLHGSIELQSRGWSLALFGTNLTDKHAVISIASRNAASRQLLGPLGDSYLVSRPREVGLRLTKQW